MHTMITLKACPVCKGHKFVPYKFMVTEGYTHEITPGVEVEVGRIVRYFLCQDCHLVFQNPRLSDKELDIYYGSGYYRRTIRRPPEGMDKGEENRAKTDIEIIRRYTENVSSHLDIGCGRGYLLKEVGAKIKVGTESDKNYVMFKDISVYTNIEQVSPKKFDLVSSIHVLEHLSYPLDFLEKMAKRVKKSGYLVIEVPSKNTRGGPLGFAHLSYFEPDVLRLMCMRAGLRVIATEFTPHLLLICTLI